MNLKDDQGYLLLSVLYILLFVTLVLSLATYILTNQLTYAKDTVEAYEVRAAIHLAAQRVQKELSEGREIKSGKVHLSSGTVYIRQIEQDRYELVFEGDKLPPMTQEKSFNTQMIKELINDTEEKKKEMEEARNREVDLEEKDLGENDQKVSNRSHSLISEENK